MHHVTPRGYCVFICFYHMISHRRPSLSPKNIQSSASNTKEDRHHRQSKSIPPRHRVSCYNSSDFLNVFEETPSAREERPPAKDPAPSHTSIQTHIQTYIQAYIQNKAEAILTKILTSIHRNQSRRPSPNSTPKNKTAKIYITLYNSKYCIRVVLCSKIDDIVCS